MKKLDWMSEDTAIEVTYGGGDYTLEASIDGDGIGNSVVLLNYYHQGEYFEYELTTLKDVEQKLRSLQPDARKWSKVNLYD